MTARGRYRVRPRPLTERQLQILRILATGASVRETAGRLGISHSNVKVRLAQAYRTLHTGGLVETYGKIGWLDTTAGHVPVALMDLTARLAAIHHESGALLAELRGER